MLDVEEVQMLTTAPAPPTLRLYQKQFIAEVYSYIRAGVRRILGVAPTGSGKTLIASQIVQHAVLKGKHVLFLVHRDILVRQSYEKLCCFGVDPGLIKSGWKENRESLIQIASAQTLSKRDWWRQYPADVIIIDEAHIVAYAAVVQQMMHLIYPEAIYLALTATPWRTKKRESLGDIFHVLVSAPMPSALIDAGYLVKPSYFSVNQADLEMFCTAKSGDFDEGQLALACDRPELVQQIVQDWQRLAWGRRTIAFAVNVTHSRHLAEAFQSAGVPASHVDGTMSAKQTNQIYQQLTDGEILVLCSCMKLTEGFDVPSVSAVLLSRPTMSRSLHFQMLGRALRLSPQTQKIDAVVVDQAGNIQRHGFVEDLKEISLNPGESRQDIEAPKKICPTASGGCGAILYAFHMKCLQCGYIFELPKKVYLIPGLYELISEDDLERYEFYRSSLRVAYQKAYAPGWAALLFREKFGHWPPDSWAKSAIFGSSPTAKQQFEYKGYLQAIAQRKEKPSSWVQRYIELEFGRQCAFNPVSLASS